MKIALHVCCGVCAAGVVERLTGEGHTVGGFFYNPNIHPREEYQRRLQAAEEIAGHMAYVLEEGDYDTGEWFAKTDTLKEEPEGGRRCEVCVRIRLEASYRFMLEKRCDVFTTTLTVSPNKPTKLVNRLGREIGGERFLERDFKKQDGFKRSSQLAREFDIYRQHYCGCTYSRHE